MHLRSKGYDRPNMAYYTTPTKTDRVMPKTMLPGTKDTWIKFQNPGLVYQLWLGLAKNSHRSSKKFLAWTSSWNTLGTKTWKRSTEHRNPRKQFFRLQHVVSSDLAKRQEQKKGIFKRMLPMPFTKHEIISWWQLLRGEAPQCIHTTWVTHFWWGCHIYSQEVIECN